jgi:hypothetical protein
MSKCSFNSQIFWRNVIMKYDFDREINRKDTQSAKWGVIQDPDNPSRWHATDDYFGKDRVCPCGWRTWIFRLPSRWWMPWSETGAARHITVIRFARQLRPGRGGLDATTPWLGDRTRLDRLHARGGAGGQFSRAHLHGDRVRRC